MPPDDTEKASDSGEKVESGDNVNDPPPPSVVELTEPRKPPDKVNPTSQPSVEPPTEVPSKVPTDKPDAPPNEAKPVDNPSEILISEPTVFLPEPDFVPVDNGG